MYAIPDFRAKLNGQSVYTISDQNGAKTIPFGATHTYMCYVLSGKYIAPGADPGSFEKEGVSKVYSVWWNCFTANNFIPARQFSDIVHRIPQLQLRTVF